MLERAVEHAAENDLSFALEYRIVRADGAVRWVLDRGQLVPGSGGRLWVDGAMFDITERRAAEEALREHEIEQARTEELRASRARIVEAADAARRRIERDLHDGAQQRLVLVSLTLKRAQARARGTPAEEIVVEASEQLREGLAELRDLAHGIHPAVLGEHGLAAALDGLVARSPIPVDVSVAPERAAPAVEAALYFTIAEALTNVAKYAQASKASVTIEIEDGTLVAEVSDDGVGGASMARGSGLRGLEDRLDAIGGTLTVHSRAGKGTTIRACAPLSPEV
jgi:signal transduction histidine kinase